MKGWPAHRRGGCRDATGKHLIGAELPGYRRRVGVSFILELVAGPGLIFTGTVLPPPVTFGD